MSPRQRESPQDGLGQQAAVSQETAAAAWRMAWVSSAAVYRAGWRLAVLAGRVQADDGVVVDDAAGLVFGDLDEPDPDLRAQLLLGDPGQAGQLAGQVDGEPAPQFRGEGVEQDVPGVVVAVRAHRLAEPRIVGMVGAGAGDVAAVGAAALVASRRGRQGSWRPRRLGAGGVHGPEAGGGEGGEHARVRGHGVGDAFAAGQAGADDLPGVVLVDLGAGGADVLAAVAAGDQEHAAGLAVGVVHDARSSPVARSMASIRPCRRIGLAQLPVVASWASQRWKSSRVARSKSSSEGGRGHPGPVEAAECPASRPSFPSVFSRNA